MPLQVATGAPPVGGAVEGRIFVGKRITQEVLARRNRSFSTARPARQHDPRPITGRFERIWPPATKIAHFRTLRSIYYRSTKRSNTPDSGQAAKRKPLWVSVQPATMTKFRCADPDIHSRSFRTGTPAGKRNG